MTTKEWLQRGRRIEMEIEALENARRETYDRLVSAVSHIDKIAVTATKDPHIFDAYAAFSERISAKVAELISVRVEIIQAVELLQDRRYRILLTCRYIRGMTWEKIAVEMHYSWKQIHRLHGAALVAIAPIVSRYFGKEDME